MISLVTSALRRNPRRVKQFANSLETRLRTIKARENSGGISRDHPISQDILGIAKLVIIEEEWRGQYEELEENPRLLSEWQATVRGGELEDTRLTAFLRDTRDITPINVGAIVNLKLESDELELEGFAAFRDAVIHGDRSGALEIIRGASKDAQSEYARRLPDLYQRELRIPGALTEARNVLDAALQDPPLGLESEYEVTKMLSDAVATPRLLEQLPQLDVNRVFERMWQLSPEERVQARQPFLQLAVIGNRLGIDVLRQVSEELGRVVDALSVDERRTLDQSISVDPSASQFRSAYMPLFLADPTLVSEAALQTAWQSLAAAFDPSSSEFEVVTLGFSAGRGPGVVRSFLESLAAYFSSAVPDPVRLAETTEVLLRSVRRLKVVDDEALRGVVQTVDANFGALVGNDASKAAEFALEFATIVRAHGAQAPDSASAADTLIRTAVSQAPFQIVQLLRAKT